MSDLSSQQSEKDIITQQTSPSESKKVANESKKRQ